MDGHRERHLRGLLRFAGGALLSLLGGAGCMGLSIPKDPAMFPDPAVSADDAHPDIAADAHPEVTAAHPTQGKTDIVVLENGDHLTGEIKELLHGRLRLKTDSMESVYIEWTDIQRIQSKLRFRVELEDGSVLIGTFEPPQENGVVIVRTRSGAVREEMAKIVEIVLMKKGWRERVDGYLNLGFSFTSASEVTQLSFGAGLTYKHPDFSVGADTSAIVTTQPGRDDQRRASIGLTGRYNFAQRWFLLGGLTTETNEELGIDLRVSFAAGPGYTIIHSNKVEFSTTVGLTVDRELAAGPDTTNVTGLFLAKFQWFVYDTPKTDFETTVSVLPYINNPDRIRTDINSRWRKEIVKDFFWDMTFFLSHDTDPPAGAVSNSDYGIITSLGYSF